MRGIALLVMIMKNRHIYKLLLACTLLLSAVQSYAQLKNGNVSTRGNDFWVTFMDNKGTSPDDRSLELTIYIVADTAVDVTADIVGGGQKRIQISNPSGGIDSICFSVDGEYTPQLVYAYANGKQAQEAEMVLNKSVHIHNTNADDDRVFSCSAFNKAGDPGFISQDAALLFPTPALGVEYVVQTYEDDSKSTQFVVVATEDGTEVTVHPGAATAKGTPAGGTITKTLNKGQSLFVVSELRSNTAESIDLSGSLICATKPVAVFAANQGPKIPSTDAYSEGYMFEQILPVQNLGTEFYFALPKDTKQNRYSIVAAYPNTTVTYTLSVNNITQSVVLQQGETLNNGGMLYGSAGLTNVCVTADKPVMAMQYLTSGAVNQIEELNMQTFVPFITNMGNPANALIPAWEHRTQKVRFVTRKMTPKDATAKQEHLVSVITPTAEVGLLQMKDQDGTTIPIYAADFRPFAGNPAMSFGSILLPNDKQYFELSSSGEGFVGFVYGLTDGIGYQYVLDFNPVPNRDSLFITDEEEVMSPQSYDLPRQSQGWYQRQEDEWPEGEERLDTAYVCDSTELHFSSELRTVIPYDSLVWRVFECDAQGRVLNPNQWLSEQIIENPTTPQTWQYRFILPDQRALPAAERDPFTYYQVQAHLVHKRVLCEEFPAFHDTLKTMIRVNRTYNDTLCKRMTCKGDTLYYFLDDVAHTDAHAAEMDTTMFVFANSEELPSDAYTQTYELGYNAYRRHYLTQAGCDSTVTFELYVCEPTLLTFDTTICENEVLSFPNSQFFQNTVFDHEGTYRDTLKTQGCAAEYGAQYDPEHLFDGCDSIWEVNVHICDTFMILTRDTFCSNGDWSVPYQWRRDGRTQADSLVRELTFTAENADQWFEYRDTVKTTSCFQCADGGCDSIFVLNLYVAPFYNTPYTEHICGQYFDPEQLALVDNAYSWDLCTSEYVWDTNNGRRILKSDIQHMTLGTTNTFVDSLISQHGCDSITTLTLTRHKAFFENSSWRMTDNQTFTWSGHRDNMIIGPLEMRPEPYVYYDSLQSDYGCDSIYRLEIYVASTFEATQTAQACDDSVFVWKQHTSADKYDPLSADGRLLWDRIHEQNVRSSESLGLEVQNADGDWETLPVGYYELVDSLKMTTIVDGAVIEADSVWILQFTKSPTYSVMELFKMCDNDTMTWQGRLYVGDKFEGEPLITPYKTVAAGHYADSAFYQTDCACDSNFHMTLDVYKSFYDLHELTVCQDSPFAWIDHEGHTIVDEEGETVDMSRITELVGTYHLFDRLFNPECPDCEPGKAGCDSIYELTLTVNPSYKNGREIVVDTAVCRTMLPFMWTGHNMSFERDTVVYDTIQTATCSCDSVVKLQLTIMTDTNRAETHYICQNAVPFLYSPHKRVYDPGALSVGEHVFVEEIIIGSDINSCSYFDTLHLIVAPTYKFVEKDTVCQDAFSPYEWTGREGRSVYCVQMGQRVDPTAISLAHAGDFVFIDSIQTRTCPECEPVQGCDSIWTLYLRVDTVYNIYDPELTICENDTVSWEHRLYVGAKFEDSYNKADYDTVFTNLPAQPAFTDDTTFLSHEGCDSTHYLTLRILPVHLQVTDTTYEHICDNESYAFYHDRTYNTAGEWVTSTHQREDHTVGRFVLTDTISSSLGCDSAVAHVVFVHPTYYNVTYDTVCQNTSYMWNETDLSARHITLNDEVVTAFETSISGDYVFIDSLKTHTYGCDSIEVLYLNIPKSYAFRTTPTISDEDSLHWQGHVFVGERFAGDTTGTSAIVLKQAYNSYEEHYPAYYSATSYCDSAYYLTVRIGNVFRDTTYDYVSDECTYDWTCPTQDGHTRLIKVQGDTISGEFVYKYDSLLTDLGFDSIYVLKLYRKPTYHFTQKDTVCQFTDYIWDTHQGHTLYDNNRAGNTTTIRTDETGTFIFTDSLLTRTTFTDPHGVNTRTTACDSVWTLELFIPRTPSYADRLVVCDNDTVRWHNRLYVGDAFADIPEVQRMWENHEIDTFIVRAAAEHKDSLYDETTFGCTITYRLALSVLAHSETRLYHAIGDNDSVWTFQPEGGNPANWHTASEFHVTDYTDPTREDRHFLFCDTLTNSAGCDSIVYDSVDVFPTYEFHEYETVCSNVPYDWRAEYTDRFRGLNYWPSNTYYDTCYTAARHLDSVFVLHLTVMPSFQKKTIQKICTNDTLDWHDEKIFFDPGEDETAQTIEYRQLYRRQSGCDSIFVMEATYYPYYHFFDTVTICPTDTLDWHGQRICWEGVYWDSLQTAACGCDSIYRLQVYNHPYYSFTQTDTVCQDTTGDVYTWYNEFGDVVPVTIALQNTGWASYSYTYPTTEHGCDSTFNLNLYVTPIYRFDSLYTMCDNETITWQSRTFTGDKAGGTYAAGTYADTVTYSTVANGPLHGCDSSYVLHLRVLPTDYVEWYDTICAGDSTLFCGYYVSEQKTYRDTLPNRHDCDSVCVLHLALRQMEYVTVDTTVCVGDVLDFHAWHLTKPGTYIDTTLTEKGCWRETTLNLHHRQPTVVHASVDRVCADTSFYNVYYTFDGLRPKTYTILYDDSAHSHRFVDVVDAELTDSVLVVPMPDHDSKADYTRPDYYRATIFFGGVCLNDSLVMDSYEFLVRYPSWVIEQHWNDAIGILTASENGGYVFDAYQWFRNGQLLAGETSYYYFQPHYLIDQAQYGVYLTRQGERLAIPTCEITAQVGDDDPLMPENNYVNVVPTAVHRQHPVVNILSPVPGSYTIIDTFGQIWKTGRYTPDAHNAFEVRIPAINGVYIFQLQADEGEKQVVKVLVQ